MAAMPEAKPIADSVSSRSAIADWNASIVGFPYPGPSNRMARANSSFVSNRNVDDWKIGMLLDSCSGGGGLWVCTARVWKRRRLAGSLIDRSLLRPPPRIAVSEVADQVRDLVHHPCRQLAERRLLSIDRDRKIDGFPHGRPDRAAELQRSLPGLLPDGLRSPAGHGDDRHARRERQADHSGLALHREPIVPLRDGPLGIHDD